MQSPLRQSQMNQNYRTRRTPCHPRTGSMFYSTMTAFVKGKWRFGWTNWWLLWGQAYGNETIYYQHHRSVKIDYVQDSSGNRIPYILLYFRHYMTDAVKAYEVKARDQWLFDYPAQVSLCGTQIWWTSEVRNLQNKLNNGSMLQS